MSQQDEAFMQMAKKLDELHEKLLSYKIDAEIEPDHIIAIGAEWRSSRETVGIVALYDTKMRVWSGRIGNSKNYRTEANSIKYIAEWGAKLTRDEVLPFFQNRGEFFHWLLMAQYKEN